MDCFKLSAIKQYLKGKNKVTSLIADSFLVFTFNCQIKNENGNKRNHDHSQKWCIIQYMYYLKCCILNIKGKSVSERTPLLTLLTFSLSSMYIGSKTFFLTVRELYEESLLRRSKSFKTVPGNVYTLSCVFVFCDHSCYAEQK